MKRGLSGVSGLHQREIDRDDPLGDRVGAIKRMGRRRLDRHDHRPSRLVAIMDEHVGDGAQAMRGGQHDARPENHAGAEARLVGAARQHHDDVIGEADVFVGRADHGRRGRGPAKAGRRQAASAPAIEKARRLRRIMPLASSLRPARASPGHVSSRDWPWREGRLYSFLIQAGEERLGHGA